MKKVAVFFAVFLIFLPSALAEWFYNSENVVVKIDISSGAEIVPLTPSGYAESAAINLTFFPKQTETQEVLDLRADPEAELKDNQLRFKWNKPQGNIDFRVNANVKASNFIKEVAQKIKFPLENLPNDTVQYTKPSSTIDSGNEEIIRTASELVKGEDDLYSAVFIIADWTKNNVRYNLSTLTAEVSQKASWVLENRQGVCDELTSLFIAMLRSVGIPARFISGISYTNSELFQEKWGPHGWAEVYFPGYGWIPFDVTYGEFGWVDPTHIKFKDSIDSDEPSTYYQWLGRNVDLKTKKLEIKAELVETGDYYKIPLKIEASSLKNAVGFGSYNLIEATIKNPNDFYYATEIYITKPKEVTILEPAAKSILLMPQEKKKVFWITKLDSQLDSRYVYTFPLAVTTLTNISSEASFTASVMEKYVSYEETSQIAKLIEEEREKKYSSNVVLVCKSEKSEYYEYEDIRLDCDARNSGNIFLDSLNICSESKCDKISLGISQAKNMSFEVNRSVYGDRKIPVTLKNSLVSKVAYAELKVKDAPKIEVENLEFPVNASYSTNFTVNFTAAKKSFSSPLNVKVTLSQNGIEKTWDLKELAEDRGFAIKFEGSQLKYGRNGYSIKVDYYDGLGKAYSTEKDFSIEMTDATMLQRALTSLNLYSANISAGTIAVMFLAGIMAFIMVILVLFRRGRRKK